MKNQKTILILIAIAAGFYFLTKRDGQSNVFFGGGIPGPTPASTNLVPGTQITQHDAGFLYYGFVNGNGSVTWQRKEPAAI